MKICVSKEKSGVRVIVYYAYTRLSNFVIECFRETKNFPKLCLPIHKGPRSNLLLDPDFFLILSQEKRSEKIKSA